MLLRVATAADIPAIARLRAEGWGEVDYWLPRVEGYLSGNLSPQQALAARHCLVATEDERIVGFVAGHLTRRYDCAGEIQWINVAPEARRKGVASQLLGALARWFLQQGAVRVCVDVEPSNEAARAFYRTLGAGELNRHWLVWDDISVAARRSGAPC